MNALLKWTLAGVFAVSVFPMSLRAEDKPDADKKDATEQADAGKDEFAVIIKDAGLEGDQLKKFQEQADSRQTRLEEWRNSEDGKKLADLRKEQSARMRELREKQKESAAATKPADDERIKELRASIKPLNDKYRELVTSTRGEVLKTLSADQQRKVVNANITRRINSAFEPAKLTDEQKAKVTKLIDEATADYLKERTLDQDPMLYKLFGVPSHLGKTIREEVLTDEQRELLKKKKEPTTQKD